MNTELFPNQQLRALVASQRNKWLKTDTAKFHLPGINSSGIWLVHRKSFVSLSIRDLAALKTRPQKRVEGKQETVCLVPREIIFNFPWQNFFPPYISQVLIVWGLFWLCLGFFPPLVFQLHPQSEKNLEFHPNGYFPI